MDKFSDDEIAFYTWLGIEDKPEEIKALNHRVAMQRREWFEWYNKQRQ